MFILNRATNQLGKQIRYTIYLSKLGTPIGCCLPEAFFVLLFHLQWKSTGCASVKKSALILQDVYKLDL